MLIKSPAKINLFLYVTGRRNNGYHDLFTLMACVDLYDLMEMEFRQPKTAVTCDHPGVPNGEANIVFKAVTLFNATLFSEKKMQSSAIFIKNTIDRVGCVPGDQSVSSNQACPNLIKDDDCLIGLRIHIKKKIPVGAGLGGGSSNAAGVLKTMNRFYGYPFSLSELMTMGLKLGSDVPFFILGGTAIARGVGEELTPVLTPEQHHVILFYPGVEASTQQVYKNLDLALTKTVKSNNKCLLKTPEIHQGFIGIKELMHNDLERSACDLYPELGLFKKELVDCLQENVMMTGSGSTFFCLFSDYKKAERCFSELSTKWKLDRKQVFLTSFLNANSIM
ncbi:MAG: 4-(cytidine 5'-diphospho)-2-C-methyl-D-erythritol kinase [Desulfamplus sp.]|nr:4-(cytidine 5'-diphospho)-2-C-methyl-D-erythritol kinase [Desulfamplus sp.]